MTAQAKNYGETPIEGKRWRRAARVTIGNPYGGQAWITYDEEQVTAVEDETRAAPLGVLAAAFDPDAVIELIDPVTLEPLGMSMPQSQVYLALFSHFVALAKARDAAEAGA
jgi:hypothetical protein